MTDMKRHETTVKNLDQLLSTIRALNPTCKEILSYGEKYAGFDQITYARDETYFGPSLHNTKSLGEYGPIHIDIGCGGIHLMLTKGSAKSFIEYVTHLRAQK